jgi:serine/threonine protein kinase
MVDVWSLGVLLFELLHGFAPFKVSLFIKIIIFLKYFYAIRV